MNKSRLILRSLQYHWRNHLGVLAGVAIATAVLTGALLVGDSVRYTLKRIALQRLGDTDQAMASGDRFFTTALADRFGTVLRPGSPKTTIARPVLELAGTATSPQKKTRASDVHVLGVDDRFWSPPGSLASSKPPIDANSSDQVALDARLAEHLHVQVGDAVVLRIAKPSALPRDVPLGSEKSESVAMPVKVAAIVGDDQLGRFSLQANQVPPYNAFVPLKALQKAVGLGDRANMLLLPLGSGVSDPASVIRNGWSLADADVQVRTLEKQAVIEVRTGRVFLDAPVVDAAPAGAQKVLTYFVNDLACGSKHTPYSMVTGREDVKDGQIVITDWLANDLSAKVGDTITLQYWVIGPARKLIEQSAAFKVGAIVPVEAPGGDRNLMPPFPGLAEVENARDWDPSIPGFDNTRIRPQDEAYWKKHRGSPKAFVNLDWAMKHWGNRFGELTALRWPMTQMNEQQVSEAIRAKLDPASVGLVFQPVRQQALIASETGTDFGGLFVGLSFFLIVAAVVLTGLLFVFGVEQRASEVGTLLSVGFTPASVRRLLMGEGVALAVIGSVLGVGLAIGYTRGVLWALTTMWSGAVAGSRIEYHGEPMTMAIGVASGVIVGAIAMYWVLRKQARQPARELLAARFGSPAAGRKSGWVSLVVASVCIIGAVVMAAMTGTDRGEAAAESFFSAGALLLIGTLTLSGRLLTKAGGGASQAPTLARLGWRNSGRRRGRSLATIAMLACGVFLVVAVNAFRHVPDETLSRKESGTGGFALFGRSTLPIYSDLATNEDVNMPQLSVAAMRLKEGDEASCLNLNAPQTPPIVGVDPRKLEGRFTFSKAGDSWAVLSATPQAGDDPNTIPGVVDDAVAQWILHKGVGDTIDYTDDRGRVVKVKIVATLAPSILQGFIVVDEQRFTKAFPTVGGYRVFLFDAPGPGNGTSEMARVLEDRLADYGLSTMSAPKRLAMFQAVENTYLSIFAALGGLGMVLGVVGLGLVVLRNVLERRAELALMRAVGFTKPSLGWLVMVEHWALLLLGLACGIIAAFVAILPALRSPEANLPVGLMLSLLAIVVVSGMVWTALATASALRQRMMDALRSE